MQTFLPYPSFSESAACLDRQRLGKQRVEAKQILMVLTGQTTAWQHHPAVKMWRGYTEALAYYGLLVCSAWKARGYRDSLIGVFDEVLCSGTLVMPPWLGDEAFHLSHKSNLVRKLPEHYGPLWPDVPNNLPYVWPTTKE